eukprot:TRINITY_DN30179_c0_g1_i1.p1 TRINITY_DN30179_c0_g1~~TRINITY_DN30179_c0_g1_i1.p1  ORF type:complete len:262 (+),score=49.13 TRINITY_DN30179_c0_g1_i1:67-786(+)
MADKRRSFSEDSTCSTRFESRAVSIDCADPLDFVGASFEYNQAYALDSAQAKAFAPALAEARGKQARSVAISPRMKDGIQMKTKAEYFPQWLVPALKPFWLFSQDEVLFDGSNEIEHQMNLAYGKSEHTSPGSEDNLRSARAFSDTTSTCSTRSPSARSAASPGTKAYCYDNAKAKADAAASLPQVCRQEQAKPTEVGECKAAQWLVPALSPFWFFRDDKILFNGDYEVENQLDLAYGK